MELPGVTPYTVKGKAADLKYGSVQPAADVTMIARAVIYIREEAGSLQSGGDATRHEDLLADDPGDMFVSRRLTISTTTIGKCMIAENIHALATDMAIDVTVRIINWNVVNSCA